MGVVVKIKPGIGPKVFVYVSIYQGFFWAPICEPQPYDLPFVDSVLGVGWQSGNAIGVLLGPKMA